MNVFNILIITYSTSLVILTGLVMFGNKDSIQDHIPNTECDLS